jgi:hypothetical protein
LPISKKEEVVSHLQALHADKRLKELGKQGRIIMKTSDTDVIVLYIYFYKLRNISAFYDLEHLCMGSHFGTVRRFLSADVMEFFLRHTGQMHLLLYVLLQSMMSTVCSSICQRKQAGTHKLFW